MNIDFHEVCKGSKFEHLKVVISEIAEEISRSMFYWKGPNGVEFVQQSEIFRVNCMDCLDRTNVVQSMIAREVVNTQLMKHGIQGNPEQSQDHKFDLIFNSSNPFCLLFNPIFAPLPPTLITTLITTQLACQFGLKMGMPSAHVTAAPVRSSET